jgi:hypothetical protein
MFSALITRTASPLPQLVQSRKIANCRNVLAADGQETRRRRSRRTGHGDDAAAWRVLSRDEESFAGAAKPSPPQTGCLGTDRQ